MASHDNPTTAAGCAITARFVTGRLMAGLALLSTGPAAAQAANEAPVTLAVPASHVARPRTPQSAVGALEDRVQLLTKELALDPTQQSALRSTLQSQRAEVVRIWSDPSVSAAVRVAATQSTAEKTADRIRALLREEQREKYMKSHRQEAPVGAPGVDVQMWMKAAEGAPAAAKEN